MRQLHSLYQIIGMLHREGEVRTKSKGTQRTIIAEFESFPTVEEAEDALLTWWSNQPHVVTLISVSKFEPNNSIIVQEDPE
jgi:hypothetical protein